MLLSKEEIEKERTLQELMQWWHRIKDNTVESSNKIRHSVLLRKKNEYKIFMEESLPLNFFCQHYFKDSKRDVTIKQVIGNQNYDAIIKGCEEFKYIEITQAINGEAEHARMFEMTQKGSTNPFGTVYKKGTKNKGLDVSTEVEDDSYFFSLNNDKSKENFKNTYKPIEEIDCIYQLLKEAVKRKAEKEYPKKTLLLVYFDDTKLEMHQDISKNMGEYYDYKKDIEDFVNQTLFPKLTSVFSGIALVSHNSCTVKIVFSGSTSPEV